MGEMTPMEIAYSNLLNAFRRAHMDGAIDRRDRIDVAIKLWEELWPDAVSAFEAKFK